MKSNKTKQDWEPTQNRYYIAYKFLNNELKKEEWHETNNEVDMAFSIYVEKLKFSSNRKVLERKKATEKKERVDNQRITDIYTRK